MVSRASFKLNMKVVPSAALFLSKKLWRKKRNDSAAHVFFTCPSREGWNPEKNGCLPLQA
jgi:hypothetical protein